MKSYVGLAALIVAAVSLISCNKSKDSDQGPVIPKGFEPMENALVSQYHDSPFKAEYEETEKAFPNALKGFRDKECEYCTLVKQYIKWNEIENKVTDGVDKIKSYSNVKFQPLYNQGIRVIPRVYIAWPKDEPTANTIEVTVGGNKRYIEACWAEDMHVDNYETYFETDEFKTRALNLIRKMAEVWDNDKRVAYVEMGLLGFFGEQHSPTPSVELQKFMADAFIANFKNKKVMIRYPDQFEDYDFGFYNDSFGHANEMGRMPKFIERISRNGGVWKTQVYGGEVAYGYGNVDLQPGKEPDETLTEPEHLNYQLECVRLLHANHVGWIGQYTPGKPDVEAGAALIQKAIGYRYVISEATFTQCLDSEHSDLEINFKVKNVGSSPLYEEAPLQFVLINPSNRKVVWSGIAEDTDCRTWLPGDKWDSNIKSYTVAPETYDVNSTFKVDTPIPEGGYILAVALLDKWSNKPAYKFAHDNYYKGGYTVLGKVGYGQVLRDPSLEGITFYDIKKDKLSYL